MSDKRTRANFVPAPQMFNLHHACALIHQAFRDEAHAGIYLVGSSIERRDFRDVDVRCILDDATFDALFPNAPAGPTHWNARWSLLCIAISGWLSQTSGLPVDFQFQRMSTANAKFNGERQALGMYVSHGDARLADRPVTDPTEGDADA